ncbi:MAG: SWIM zinc finger family protein [Planctomycetes bacterium]|nr:SWIM zinc finger family protein [Planctomycetota bacterium]
MPAAGTIEHTTHFAAASRLDVADGRPDLRLEAAIRPEHATVRFDGELTRAALSARLLASIRRVVGARYHVPAAMLGRILRQSDPVLTVGDDTLRVEGFSACAGVYARADFAPGSHLAAVRSPGTTNVDFGDTLCGELARVRDGDSFRLRIGAEGVAVTHGGGTTFERKVPLPVRWLRSFVAVQDVQTALPLRHEVSGVEGLRFLRSLPRATSRVPVFVVAAGRGLRVTSRADGAGVRVVAPERLRPLEDLLHGAQTLRIHGGPDAPGSAWTADFGDRRFTLLLSPEVWRGFSGEGRALAALTEPPDEALVSLLRRALHWRSSLRAADLARELGEPKDTVARALVVLGVRGAVGYDLADGAWFHRELPYDLAWLDALQPRFAAAEALVRDVGAVRRAADDSDGSRWDVRGTDVVHFVVLGSGDTATCTCPWHAKHGSERGACKHVLAARMARDAADDGDAQ